MMTGSGLLYLIGPPRVVEVFHHLGYPDYFRRLLGLAKILGIVTLLWAREQPRLREWVYAGFSFDLLAAALSHAFSGDAIGAWSAPLLALAILTGSYVWWHLPRARERERG
jgi:hypothetical protein